MIVGSGEWFLCPWLVLLCELAGTSRVSWFSNTTSPFRILHIFVRRDNFRRCSSVCHFRSVSISLKLHVLLNLFKAYRTPLRWTISIVSTFFLVYGSQTLLAYSTCGRTRVWYAVAFRVVLLIWRLRFRNDSVVLFVGDVVYVFIPV